MEAIKIINGQTIDELINSEIETHETMFWGKNITITPALVDEVHGDGLQIVYLSSIYTRPNYYILKIDSSIILGDDKSLSDEDQSEYGTVWEMLLRMIEDQYDNIERYKENKDGLYVDCNEDVEPFEYCFPMLNWGGGSWGRIANFKTGETREL